MAEAQENSRRASQASERENNKEDDKKQSNAESKNADKKDKSKEGNKGANDDNKSKKKPEKKKNNASVEEKQTDQLRNSLTKIENQLEKLNEEMKSDKPERREYSPYVYNSLNSYGDTHTVNYALYTPDKPEKTYFVRNTATGLTEPWHSHRMDTEIEPKKFYYPPNKQNKNEDGDKDGNAGEEVGDEEEEDNEDAESERPPKEGSTLFPKYPNAEINAGEMFRGELYFSELPKLRKEIHEKYSTEAQARIDEDYTRTKQDFYRMELDRMDKIHPQSRGPMRATYFAYLQNTPGSKKAVNECVKKSDQKLKEKEEKENQKKDSQRTSRSTARGSEAGDNKKSQSESGGSKSGGGGGAGGNKNGDGKKSQSKSGSGSGGNDKDKSKQTQKQNKQGGGGGGQQKQKNSKDGAAASKQQQQKNAEGEEKVEKLKIARNRSPSIESETSYYTGHIYFEPGSYRPYGQDTDDFVNKLITVENEKE